MFVEMLMARRMFRIRWWFKWGGCFAVGALLSISQADAALMDVTLDLKVLVISTGTPAEDIGLDLIDDILLNIGVPYDVLDASRDTLTSATLFTEQRGHYNGIILTNSELFLSDGGSGFSAAEWVLLHNYERDFAVRESVISGFPVVNPALGLDYGMSNTSSGSQFSGTWAGSAGGTAVFEYINRANSIPINGFAFVAQPRVLGVGDAGPTVEPLLIDNTNINRALISHLRYPDGREVLLSTMTNAWYLLHSQIIAYEFLNFATQGIFIGARQVFLETHMDDYFLANTLWNTATNVTDSALTYRMNAADLINLVDQQQALRDRYSRLGHFFIDLPFNGQGVSLGTPSPSVTESLPFVSSTLRQQRRTIRTHGKRKRVTRTRLLLQFDLPSPLIETAQTALLNLWLDSNNNTNQSTRNIALRVCRIIQPWHDPFNASNVDEARSTTARVPGAIILSGNRLPAYDRATCVNAKTGVNMSIDITSLTNAWLMGEPNYGVMVLATDKTVVDFITKADSQSLQWPQLVVTSPASLAPTTDPLTAATLQFKDEFRFINHTFNHRNMDVSAGTGYNESILQITENRKLWALLDLPERIENNAVLLTGNHSGLSDTNNTEFDFSDDLPYPVGKNDAFLQAAQDSGVKFLAADASRINQAAEAFVPGFDILLLPRWPTNIFVNATQPEVLTDAYNYTFYERYVEQGQNPCVIAGAICTPSTYQNILQAEADIALRHMLSYQPWPHFFHQSNVRDYGSGNTLLTDWLNAVMSLYEQYLTLSIKNPAYYRVGELTFNRLLTRDAQVTGVWNVIQQTITLSSTRPVEGVLVTGVSGGESYGGQRIGTLSVTPMPVTIKVDKALFE